MTLLVEMTQNKQYKQLEYVLHQVLKNIDQSLKRVPKHIPKDCFQKFRDAYMEENRTSFFSGVEVGESSKKKTEYNEEIVTGMNEGKMADEELEDEIK